MMKAAKLPARSQDLESLRTAPKSYHRVLPNEAGPPYDKQRIQMGLRKGNAVPIYFRSGVVHYQCVLIALASGLSNSKPRQGQRKLEVCLANSHLLCVVAETVALTYLPCSLGNALPFGDVRHLLP